jgi:propionyl-CoA carboxylase beta chain
LRLAYKFIFLEFTMQSNAARQTASTTLPKPTPPTPLDWIQQLADPGSFMELDQSRVHHSDGPGMEKFKREGDGVVSGIARVGGKPVAIYAQDPSFMGGALGRVQAEKICRVLDIAAQEKYPVVSLIASGGARIQEGVDSLSGYGEIFYKTVALSGKVPQISVAIGTCAGGAVYQPALTDLVVMIEGQSRMFITGPTIVEAVTHEAVTPDELVGFDIYCLVFVLFVLLVSDGGKAFRIFIRVL